LDKINDIIKADETVMSGGGDESETEREVKAEPPRQTEYNNMMKCLINKNSGNKRPFKY
jgi:hypothetical protein